MGENQIQLMVRNWDDSKKAEVTLPNTMLVRELVAECCKNWSLPAGETYTLRDVKTNKQLEEQKSLVDAGLTDGAEIQVFPNLEGGYLG